MDNKALLSSISLATREFSLLLVDPNEKFITWLREIANRKGMELWRIYSSEENTVLVIPPVGSFSAPGSFKSFIEDWKSRLLSAELTRFGLTPKEFGRSLTAETFDDFFSISVRDTVHFVTDFKAHVA